MVTDTEPPLRLLPQQVVALLSFGPYFGVPSKYHSPLSSRSSSIIKIALCIGGRL
jgi:hypothetical protein